MKHGLLAIAVLLGATLVTAQAEYIRFIYNPGVAKKEAPQPGQANDPNNTSIPGVSQALASRLTPQQRQKLLAIPEAAQAGGPAVYG